MRFGTGTEILLCVCEEVVGTGAAEVRTAYFGVGDGELGDVRGGACAHELFWKVVSLVFDTRVAAMKSQHTYLAVSSVRQPSSRRLKAKGWC